MNKFPCKNCISFAICYNTPKDIYCELLYEFVSIMGMSNNGLKKFLGYKRGARTKVEKVFKRYVENTDIRNYQIALTNDKMHREENKEWMNYPAKSVC